MITLLHTLQNRARRPAGKRPPSRRPRGTVLPVAANQIAHSSSDDLFSPTTSHKNTGSTDTGSTDTGPADIFASLDISQPIKVQPVVVDDIFAPSKAAGKVPPSVLSQPDSTQHTVKDDLFIEATDASGKALSEEAAKSEKKSKKVKKVKGRPDDDLFGNTDDIFGDLSAASPRPKKATKVKKSTKSEESSEVKVKRAKKKKKPTTEAQDLFDSPSIFDDPLGLGN